MTARRTAVITQILIVLLLPLFLLLVGVDIIASKAYIRHEYGLPGFPASELYQPEERLRLAEATLYYLRSGEDVSYLQGLVHSGQPVYNAREVEHLVDVKNVMTGAFLVERAALVIVVVSTIYLLVSRVGADKILRSIAAGCVLLWGMAAIVGATAIVSFDWFFTQFHRLFFSEGTWTFAYTDTLIQLFPLRFWMDATLIVGVLALGGSLMLGLASGLFLRRGTSRERQQKQGEANVD